MYVILKTKYDERGCQRKFLLKKKTKKKKKKKKKKTIINSQT